MNKQKEIREWINKYLTRQFLCDPEELPDDECDNEAKEILSYLHSRGVVIDMGDQWDEIQCHYYHAVEPLIEEVTDAHLWI